MNPNHPDYKPPRLSPITYHLEEYDPKGMDGIAIIECCVEVDIVGDDVFIIGITFPANYESNCMIPCLFETALMKVLEADDWLMGDIARACAEEYANNH